MLHDHGSFIRGYHGLREEEAKGDAVMLKNGMAVKMKEKGEIDCECLYLPYRDCSQMIPCAYRCDGERSCSGRKPRSEVLAGTSFSRVYLVPIFETSTVTCHCPL